MITTIIINNRICIWVCVLSIYDYNYNLKWLTYIMYMDLCLIRLWSSYNHIWIKYNYNHKWLLYKGIDIFGGMFKLHQCIKVGEGIRW